MRRLMMILTLFVPNTVDAQEEYRIPPDAELIQFDEESAVPLLVEATRLVRADQARTQYGVDGSNIAVAVLDTGCRTSHIDFRGRVLAVRNFTNSDNGDPNTVTDRQGHGTNVAGIIAAGGNHVGMAPRANLIIVKVLNDSGSSVGTSVADGLQWVIDNAQRYGIRVVNMSLGASNNHRDDSSFTASSTREKIRLLRSRDVAVVIAAGNGYAGFASEGMSTPAIFRESISVGAVYDADIGNNIRYASGAKAYTTAPDRICPFSQRLHQSTCGECRTDVFAPGAVLTSTGITDDSGTSMMNGTSQAAPIVAGIITLMQQHYNAVFARYPTVDEIERALRASAIPIIDGDAQQDYDNVPNTRKQFERVDAINAVDAIVRNARVELRQQRLGLR